MVIKWNELRDARERIGLTQGELAEELGVSTRTITNWESNGVARKAEYKVERFFGDNLTRDSNEDEITRQLDQHQVMAGLSSEEQIEHDPWMPPGRLLRVATDEQLLTELMFRARKRANDTARSEQDRFNESLGPNVTPLRQAEEPHEEDFEESGERVSRPTLSAAKKGHMKADEPHAE